MLHQVASKQNNLKRIYTLPSFKVHDPNSTYNYNIDTLIYIHLMRFSRQISPSWSILCTVHLLEQTPKLGKLWLYHRNNQTGAEYGDA